MNLEIQIYLHIREYAMDGDTGQWYPTKSGYSMPADEVSSLVPLLQKSKEKKLEKDLFGIHNLN